jgi:hypothetical protein
MATSPNESATNSGGGTLPKIAYGVAAVLILAYLVAVTFAWLAVGEAAEAWARRVELLTGLEALAFAAAGAVLGVTVQRPTVTAAENRAEDAEARASANEEAAKTGNALAAVVEAKANRVDERADNLREANRVEEGMKTELTELADIASSIRS